MRHLTAATLLVLLLTVVTGCGDDDSELSNGSGSNAGGTEGSGGENTAVPPCPFTAEQVSDVVGQPMTDEGSCLFGDGKGVASLTVTTASELAGLGTYDYSREQADAMYDEVSDLEVDGEGYVAVDDLGGEAAVVVPSGTYTLIMSNFEQLDPDGYDEALRALVDQALESQS